jgi:hypothetical protein
MNGNPFGQLRCISERGFQKGRRLGLLEGIENAGALRTGADVDVLAIVREDQGEELTTFRFCFGTLGTVNCAAACINEVGATSVHPGDAGRTHVLDALLWSEELLA